MHQHKKKAETKDPGTHQVPSSLTGSGHGFWSLSPLSVQLVSSPPQDVPSRLDLTQQRGHEPECEGLQGHVWELQHFPDCTVQLMGTDRGQVLHGQGHYRVISQVHQYISCWNTGQAGSAEVHHQPDRHSPLPSAPYHEPGCTDTTSRSFTNSDPYGF